MRALSSPLLLAAAALWAAVGCHGAGDSDEPGGERQTGLGGPISEWPEKPVGGPVRDLPGDEEKLPPSSNGSGAIPVVLDAGVSAPSTPAGGTSGAPTGAGGSGGAIAGGLSGGAAGAGGQDAGVPPPLDGIQDAGAHDGGVPSDGAAADADRDAGDAGALPFPFAFPIPRLF